MKIHQRGAQNNNQWFILWILIFKEINDKNAYRKKPHLEVYEVITALANEGSVRRSDIIVLHRERYSGLIIDPTIRFKNCKQQPKLVNKEEQNIHNKTIYLLFSKIIQYF